MKNCMSELLKKRRSIYNLGNKEIIADKDVVALVENAVMECPSAFNSQSGRCVVLLGNQHKVFWDKVTELLHEIVPDNKFQPTLEKMEAFARARGTILFFEDVAVIEDLQARFPLYKENFSKWSEHASGMLQYIVWTSLAEQNVGASLQHYNPLIDNFVVEEWNLPQTWRLVAQMPFGSIETKADEKTYLSIDDRVKVFK